MTLMVSVSRAVTIASAAMLLWLTGVSAQSKKTVWNGIYVSDQANRGQLIYDKRCTECHQDDLSGGGDEAAAPLRGFDFMANWNNRSVGALFRKIQGSMPKNAPGTLSPAETADLVAFFLKKNQIPAFEVPLPIDVAELDKIL